MDASIAKAMKVAVGISFPSENEGRWLEALSVPGNFRNSHWSCFSETSEPYTRVGKDVSCALNMQSACHRAGIWVVPRNFFGFVPMGTELFLCDTPGGRSLSADRSGDQRMTMSLAVREGGLTQ